MSAGARDTFVTFEYRETTQDPIYGTTVEGEWAEFSSAWANVQDVLPSRGERVAESVSIASHPARIRIDQYDGIGVTASMRIQIEGDEVTPDRTLRITAGPAFVQATGELEFMAEQLTTEGHEP